jgi:hypothetical protein
MKFFKVLFVLVALSFHQASNAQVSIDVCAYRKAAYVDTLDNLSIGASITTWAAGMPVIVQMTTTGLAVVSAPAIGSGVICADCAEYWNF